MLAQNNDGKYHLMGCMLSAASCNKWWMEQILNTENYQAEQDPIKNLGENKIFYLPYLMGERSPHNDPNARSVFMGMTMDTTRADMTQAALEVVETEEGPGYGGAILAAVGCGEFSSVHEAAKKLVKVVDVVEPDPFSCYAAK